MIMKYDSSGEFLLNRMNRRRLYIKVPKSPVPFYAM